MCNDLLSQSERVQKIVTLRNDLFDLDNKFEKAHVLNQLTKEWIHFNLDSAIKYSQVAQRLIEENNIEKEYGQLYLNLFEISIFNKVESVSLDYLSLAEQAFDHYGDRKDYVMSICRMAEILVLQHDMEQAETLLKKALDFANKFELDHVRAYVCFLYGRLNYSLGNYADAESCFLKAIDLHQQLGKANPAALYSELGNLYFHQGRYQHAWDSYAKAVPYVSRQEDQAGIGYIFSNLGRTELELGKYEDAIASLKKSLEARQKIHYSLGEIVSHTELSVAYSVIGNYELANDHLNTAMQFADFDKVTMEKARVFVQKANLFLQTGELDSALVDLKQADSIYRAIDYQPGVLSTRLDFMRYYLLVNNEERVASYYDSAKVIAVGFLNQPKVAEASYYMALSLIENHQASRAIDTLMAHLVSFQTSPKLAIDIYSLLLEGYRELNDQSNSDWCMDELSAFRDSIRYLGLSPVLNYEFTRNDLKIVREQLDSHTMQMSVMQKVMAGLGVALMIMVFVILIFRWDSRKKSLTLAAKKKRLLELQDREKKLIDEIEQERNIRLQEAKELVDVIKSKNALLSELKGMISENYEETPRLVRKDIKTMLNSIQDQLSTDDSFLEEIMLLEEEFINDLKIKYPELTPKERRLCIYIRMNFSNQEIAGFSNVQTSSVEKSRFRLKQKFGLPSEQDLKEFIAKL